MTSGQPLASQVCVVFDDYVRIARASISQSRGEILVTSPYLTSDIAETILQDAKPSTTIILTLFEAELFASGASSLQTLTSLVDKGFSVRYLDNLHAKVIATPAAIHVGSQNLTVGGTRNLEATAISPVGSLVEPVESKLREWVSASSPITREMILEMEREVLSITSSFLKTRNAARIIDNLVREHEADREQVRNQHELIKTIERSYSSTIKAVRGCPASRGIRLNLIRAPSFWDQYDTLKAPLGVDLTKWELSGERITLHKRERYLLLAPEMGKLGWVALNKTQLTQFGVALTPQGNDYFQRRQKWKTAEVAFNTDLKSIATWNVRFTLQNSTSADTVNIRVKFTLEGMELVEVEDEKDSNRVSVFDFEEVRSQLRRHMTRPFKYEANRHGGYGQNAKQFCRHLSNNPVLRLREHQGRHFFTLERS